MKTLVVVALVACSARGATPHPPPPKPALAPASDAMPWSSSGIDWTKPPAVGDDVPFAPPAIEQLELANRMRVLVVERHRIPLVSIITVHGAAGSREDGARRGLAAVCADVLREGNAEAFEAASATLDASITTDYSTLAMSVLADHLGDGIGLLATALRKPRFDDADLSRIRTERLAELADREDRAHLLAARLFDAVVFGEHPYARASDGRAATLRAITPGDLRAFWRRAYSPDTTTMIVVGDVTRASLEPLLAKAFGDWTGTTAAPRTPLVAGPSTPQLAYIDRPNATTASILVGRRGYAAGDSRQIAADVANAALSGADASSRFKRVAGALGIAPGLVNASFWHGQWGGTWTVAALVDTASALEIISELRKAIDAARTTDASQDEIDRAKRELLRRLPPTFETNASTARALVRLVAHNQPLDFYATYRDQLAAVTPASARAALAPLLSDLTIVVVGDWKAIGPKLTAPGLPVHRYDSVP